MTLRTALAWSRHAPVGAREIAVAALGMAVPVAVGLAAGRTETGFTVGLGAMLLAGEPAPPGQAGGERPSPASAAAPALAAVLAATALVRLPGGDAATVALAGFAAMATNYSRPLAVAAIRFTVYLILGLTLLHAAGPGRDDAALVFGLGALWNIAIRVLLRDRRPAPPPAPSRREPTSAQRRAHFRRVTRTLAGWQFPARLMAGLATAMAVRAAFPARHFDWIVLTVVLLTQRPIEHLPAKAVQRALGTLGGVALTWAILAAALPPAGLGVAIVLLATGAGLARSRNYLAYSALATPAILLVLDLARPLAPALLVDRLVATLVGAGIVVALNLLFDRLTRADQRAAAKDPT